MADFVLVHGAWHGAWCWQRIVPPLWAAGHRAFAVSLSGLGERAHPLSGGITIETHVADTVGSRCGCCFASRTLHRDRRWSAATKRPCTWQARMRSCGITGVWLASDNSNPVFTAATIDGSFGRVARAGGARAKPD